MDINYKIRSALNEFRDVMNRHDCAFEADGCCPIDLVFFNRGKPVDYIGFESCVGASDIVELMETSEPKCEEDRTMRKWHKYKCPSCVKTYESNTPDGHTIDYACEDCGSEVLAKGARDALARRIEESAKLREERDAALARYHTDVDGAISRELLANAEVIQLRAKVAELEAELEPLKKYFVDSAPWEDGDLWELAMDLGLLKVAKNPTPEFIEEWGDDVAMWIPVWVVERDDLSGERENTKLRAKITELEAQCEMLCDPLQEIYDWTEHKATPWAKRAKAALDLTHDPKRGEE